MGYVSKYITENIHFPHPEYDEKLFIGRIIKLSSRFPGSLLFPVSDETLKVVSYGGIKENVYLADIVPDLRFLESAGIPTDRIIATMYLPSDI